MLQINNMVRDAIKSEVTMLVHYDRLERNGKQLVVVNIQRGTNRRHYLVQSH